MLVEVTIQSLWLDGTTNTPVVILKELEGERILPIWIGPGEASAIATKLAGMESARPLTHDLLCSSIEGLGGSLEKVVISRVEDSTYYAEILILRDGELVSLDARPSDSIALALRFDTQIFAQDELLDLSSEYRTEKSSSPDGALPDALTSMGPNELEEHLRRLNPEDFGRFIP